MEDKICPGPLLHGELWLFHRRPGLIDGRSLVPALICGVYVSSLILNFYYWAQVKLKSNLPYNSLFMASPTISFVWLMSLKDGEDGLHFPIWYLMTQHLQAVAWAEGNSIVNIHDSLLPNDFGLPVKSTSV